MTDTAAFEAELAELGTFWERFDFPNGVSIGPGRNKALLWKDYLGKSLPPSDFEGKSILDMGCNAGGNLVELAKFKPSRLVGCEGNDLYLKQAKFVLEQFHVDAELKKYRFAAATSPERYAQDLGTFDVIFFLGVIYHLNKATNLGVLRYIRKYSQRCILSSQTENSPGRPDVDWDVSRQGITDLLLEAGFRGVRDLYEKKPEDPWTKGGLTNTWYFEAIF